MPARLRLTGIEAPNVVSRTFHRDGIINAAALRHALSQEYLRKIFPLNAGVCVDFLSHEKIALRAESHKLIAHFNNRPLSLLGQDHLLSIGDGGILKINAALFKVEIFHSYF